MTTIELIGYTAASLTTLAFVPQAVACLRSGSTDGLSLSTYSMFCTGVALWLGYGLFSGSWPVAISNAATLSIALVILAQIIRNTRPVRLASLRRARRLRA